LHDRPGQSVTLLAVPVMQAARYGGQPVYFTDIIVRADSAYHAFDDLRGAAYAYNGADSNSGYNMPRDFLLARGETRGFFGRTIESGSHQRSIQMVLDGEVDASGIDSLVLEMEVHLRPAVGDRLRVVQAVGPCPSPPVVAAGDLPEATRARLRHALLAMHMSESGQAILRDGLMARFVEVDDAYYNPIREMARRAQEAGYIELK
jgi:phosphonate transport system substrate-binding protein